MTRSIPVLSWMFLDLVYGVGAAGCGNSMPKAWYPDSSPTVLTMGLLVPMRRGWCSRQGTTTPPSSHSLQMSKSFQSSFVVHGEHMGCGLSASRGNDYSKPPRGSSRRGPPNNLSREINRKLVDPRSSTETLLAVIDEHLDDMSAINMSTALNR